MVNDRVLSQIIWQPESMPSLEQSEGGELADLCLGTIGGAEEICSKT